MKVIYSLFLVAGLLSLASCQIEKTPSFLIIAIDRLAFNAFACSDDKSVTNSGLTVLCREALRFTHAYTTSTQSAAAMGSLLTGLYPFQHRLHRSFDRIDYKVPQLQSVAIHNKYRTAFWSGSPTILKKTGLSKDFEIFDDSSFLERRNLFSDLRLQHQSFIQWANENKQPFLAVIHNSELESMNQGETEISNFEKLDEHLAQLFAELKAKDLWDHNYVIVTGLQGQSNYSRINETSFSNLHSENTNVLMFIKPPREKGDEGINWKIDIPINIADLGISLLKTIDPDFESANDLQFPIKDLSQLWKAKKIGEDDANLVGARHILVEAANTWKARIETRYAVLFRNLIYIEADKDEVYNILTDGLETIDIFASHDKFVNENKKELDLLRQQKNVSKWTDFQNAQYKWVLSNREYWSKPNNRLSVLENELQVAKQLDNYDNPLVTIAQFNSLLNDPIKKKLITPDKEILFLDAKRNSINLALDNIWGIWYPARTFD